MTIPTALTVAPRGYSFHGSRMVKDELGTLTRQPELCQEYEEAVSEDRYQVVQRGFWWRVKVGDGDALYGKFHSKAAAEDMAQLLRREFLNGAFVVRKRDAELGKLGALIADGGSGGSPVPHA